MAMVWLACGLMGVMLLLAVVLDGAGSAPVEGMGLWGTYEDSGWTDTEAHETPRGSSESAGATLFSG